MLTLFIGYGEISGLARAKGPLPAVSEMPISETGTKDKLLWLERMVRMILHEVVTVSRFI